MSKPKPSSKLPAGKGKGPGAGSGGSAALSLRGGAMLMRSISRFLSKSKGGQATGGGGGVCSRGGRGRSHAAAANLSAAGAGSAHTRRRKKMTDKDGKSKLSQRAVDAIKRETHFNKTEIEALYKVYRKLLAMNRPKTHHDKGTRTIAASAAAATAAGGAAAGVAPASGANIVSQAAVGAGAVSAAGSIAANTIGGGVMRKASTITEGIDRTVFCELLHITFDIVTEDMLMERIFCVWDRENANLITPMSWFAGLSVFLRGTTQEQIEFCFAVYDLNVDGYIRKEEMFQLLKNCLIKHPQEEDPDEGVKDFVEIVMRKLDKDKDGKVSLMDYQQSVLEEPLLLEAFGKCLPEERARDTFLSTMKV